MHDRLLSGGEWGSTGRQVELVVREVRVGDERREVRIRCSGGVLFQVGRTHPDVLDGLFIGRGCGVAPHRVDVQRGQSYGGPVGFISPNQNVFGVGALSGPRQYVGLIGADTVLADGAPRRTELGIYSEVRSGRKEVVAGVVGLEAAVAAGIVLAVVDELITEGKERGRGFVQRLGRFSRGGGRLFVAELQFKFAGRALQTGEANDGRGRESGTAYGEDVSGGEVAIHDARLEVVVEDTRDVEDGHLIRVTQHMRLQLGQLHPIAVLDDQDEAVLVIGRHHRLGDLNDERLCRALEVRSGGDEFKLCRHR